MFTHNNISSDKIRDDNTKFNQKWIKKHGLKYFNNVSVENFENPNENSSPMMIVWLKNIDRLMDLIPKTVKIKKYLLLDVGCGVGISTIYFKKKYVFKGYYGFDLEKKFIKQAKINLSLANSHHINFFHNDVSNFFVSDKPIFLYLFNPFNLKIIKILIKNNIKLLKKNKSIIGYVNDMHIDYFHSLDLKIMRNDYYNISLIFF